MKTEFDTDDFARVLLEGCEEAAKVPPCASLLINEPGGSIELLIDTKADYYSEWIKGEGADICLYRERDTEKVVGVHLPLRHAKLMIGRIPKEPA